MYSIIDTIISWLLFIFGVTVPFYLILGAIGITGFRELTTYDNYNTFYYKTNAALKILLSFVIVIIAAYVVWWIGAIITVAILLSWITLKNSSRKIFLVSLLLFSTIIGTVWSYAPSEPPEIIALALHTSVKNFTTIWVWPPYFTIFGYVRELSLQSIIYSFQISFRFTAALVASLLLIQTSTPSQIIKSMAKIKVPIPVTFAIIVALKTIPLVFESFDSAIKIQMIRGYGPKRFKGIRVFYILAAGIRAIVPTIVHLFRGAKDIAISADTRAFRAYKTRTLYGVKKLGREDYIFATFIILAVTLSLVALLSGFGRAIPYLT
ncbi:energy-coupling factor transporter transmembrane component T family protein [Caldiplasma sukawensis]